MESICRPTYYEPWGQTIRRVLPEREMILLMFPKNGTRRYVWGQACPSVPGVTGKIPEFKSFFLEAFRSEYASEITAPAHI
jgi:hypothetical protein